MVETNQKVFDKFRKLFEAKSKNKLPDGKRYIVTNDADKSWLTDSTILKITNFSHNTGSCFIEFQNNKYYCVWGLDIDYTNIDRSLLVPIEMNSGVFTLLLAECSISLSKAFNDLEFLNIVPDNSFGADKMGYVYDDLIKYYEPVQLFHIPTASVFNDLQDCHRIAIYLIAKNPELMSLKVSVETLNQLEKVSIEGPSILPFDNIYNGIVSVSWRHAYLELYRNIEKLFTIPYIGELYDGLKLKTDFITFASQIEDKTGWRPKEDDALKRLFENMPTHIDYMSVLTKVPGYEKSEISNFIYKLRNSIVHFRAGHNTFNISEDVWNGIILILLQISLHLFSEHRARLI